jgi:hypothetical protein
MQALDTHSPNCLLRFTLSTASFEHLTRSVRITCCSASYFLGVRQAGLEWTRVVIRVLGCPNAEGGARNVVPSVFDHMSAVVLIVLGSRAWVEIVGSKQAVARFPTERQNSAWDIGCPSGVGPTLRDASAVGS